MLARPLKGRNPVTHYFLFQFFQREIVGGRVGSCPNAKFLRTFFERKKKINTCTMPCERYIYINMYIYIYIYYFFYKVVKLVGEEPVINGAYHIYFSLNWPGGLLSPSVVIPSSEASCQRVSW